MISYVATMHIYLVAFLISLLSNRFNGDECLKVESTSICLSSVNKQLHVHSTQCNYIATSQLVLSYLVSSNADIKSYGENPCYYHIYQLSTGGSTQEAEPVQGSQGEPINNGLTNKCDGSKKKIQLQSPTFNHRPSSFQPNATLDSQTWRGC